MIFPVKSLQPTAEPLHVKEAELSKQRVISKTVIDDSFRPLLTQAEESFDKISKPSSTAELLINLTDTVENLKSSILKFELQHQKDLIDNILTQQKKSFELIKNKNKTYEDLAKWNVFENIFKGILATASIIGGISLFSANPWIGGFLISSGVTSISL